MKAMVLFILISSLGMFMFCCSTLFPDEKLTLQRKDYNGNELKIDGYYFREDKISSRVIIYFLYNNGILLYGGAPLISEIEKREREFTNGDWYHTRKNDKAAWGIFCIDEQKIKIEKWEASTGIGLPVYMREGNILNDTTFHIIYGHKSDESNKSNLDELWHFKQFANKPDSTNVYIK
jgi:hypothetical protein